MVFDRLNLDKGQGFCNFRHIGGEKFQQYTDGGAAIGVLLEFLPANMAKIAKALALVEVESVKHHTAFFRSSVAKKPHFTTSCLSLSLRVALQHTTSPEKTRLRHHSPDVAHTTELCVNGTRQTLHANLGQLDNEWPMTG